MATFELYRRLTIGMCLTETLDEMVQRLVMLRRNDVPKGYLAVYVGVHQKKRFVIPISYLKQPSIQNLLSEVEQEFGFDHPMGGLTIPCREDYFLSITSHLKRS
ncbi:auxin-responsive protein SAUR21-like [Abrus precatorius]|uniref:Auxin-responsive protein SAUR21-like n=1 Tax=Abrus precatorius TaxID=3816 RepID=A0A8B8M711_ABRPR|nr:auxin-responsive protein SAUR21-like [Abrus precatorius]